MGVEWGTKEAMGNRHGIGERGIANIDWEEVGQHLVIDDSIVECCLISATLDVRYNLVHLWFFAYKFKTIKNLTHEI